MAVSRATARFWRRLLASGDSHAVVFEDDLVIADGFAVYLQDGWVPRGADLVRFETFLIRVHVDRGDGTPASGRRLHRLRSRHPGTGAYLVCAPAARRLLDLTETVSDPIDEALFNEASPLFAGLTTYQMDPAPVIQGNLVDGPLDSWTTTSITERFAEVGVQTGPAETKVARLGRRLREEFGALRDGTRYDVVPFG